MEFLYLYQPSGGLPAAQVRRRKVLAGGAEQRLAGLMVSEFSDDGYYLIATDAQEREVANDWFGSLDELFVYTEQSYGIGKKQFQATKLGSKLAKPQQLYIYYAPYGSPIHPKARHYRSGAQITGYHLIRIIRPTGEVEAVTLERVDNGGEVLLRTWHENVDRAIERAEHEMGVRRDEWSR